ncbi:DUF3466 family protein [Vibrio parahaemolyticus]|uniref:DUF3466 family protein n=1 Tax=Vibrio parahaemolyticus TaxID=670 RepID=UPI001121AAE1|nr:DUF3466 family protein [Vibrio parahaemolyticus]EHZ2647323.1 DUF3466 family protein [Vibrio parahaemolyticus]EKB1969602.1 DUF3466 family protein [Vibrio parahaemolyticus]ELM4065632.1 DUF3466 family protein [Vibrio parahaemolyticus]TOB25544.1 hypothetical protein CGK11_19735 [Vibrio parahaemolyticus]TOG29669.1 hypothetical protein CGJ04_15845 [Vibrio parahaemolyticus]
MNCSNKFKLTAVALMVGTAMNANAALYQVIEVSPEVNGDVVDYQTAYGVAIQQGDVIDASTDSPFALGCFDATANCTPEQFKLAIETRTTPISASQEVDGNSYREEIPFAMDAGFYYLDEVGDFERYCKNEKRYSTCDSWAAVNWSPWGKERYSKDYTSNALAFVENSADAYKNEYNNVINSLTESGQAVGNQSIVSASDSATLETRNTVVAPTLPNIVPSSETAEVVESRAWKTDGTFTVGSISEKASNTNGAHHTSKAAIWDKSGLISQVPWPSTNWKDGERLAQGSMRDFVVDGTTIYGVGYNTYSKNDNYLNATVFVGTLESESSLSNISTWQNKVVVGARQREGDDTVHSNSRLTNVNKNFVAIGEAKRSGAYPMPTGSTPNRLFIVDDVRSASLSAIYPTTGIFFNGAGGKMGGINAYNEIVGQLDAESTREDDGKPRRKRGFIYPYIQDDANNVRAETLFDGKAWFLDTLTNGGEYSEANNAFRIIDATDINDAGVISATAMKCAGGYNSTAHNASCNGTEEIVAVKLMPIPNQTKEDIVARSVESDSAERQGAGLGWLALTMLGLFGFRRK